MIGGLFQTFAVANLLFAMMLDDDAKIVALLLDSHTQKRALLSLSCSIAIQHADVWHFLSISFVLVIFAKGKIGM